MNYILPKFKATKVKSNRPKLVLNSLSLYAEFHGGYPNGNLNGKLWQNITDIISQNIYQSLTAETGEEDREGQEEEGLVGQEGQEGQEEKGEDQEEGPRLRPRRRRKSNSRLKKSNSVSL